MVARTQQGIGRRSITVGLTGILAAAGATVLTSTPTSAAPSPSASAAAAGERCRVVRLPQADGFADGGLMDIEVVDGRTVYYGNGFRFDRAGEEHQRAFVWHGRRSAPVRVGPAGYDHDIALELTASGLVNGSSENNDGTSAQWVQDLATGEITFFDADSGPRGTEHGWTYVRRINDSGAAVGIQGRSPDPESWSTDAIGFDSPTADLEVLAGSAEAFDALGFGVNNAGDRVGFVLDGSTHPDDEEFYIFQPTLWRADGSVEQFVHPHALDASVRNIKDDGSASGEMSWGDHPSTAHLEAAYWPTPDENVGLGVLRGGAISVPFGMDEGGALVGLMDRGVREGHRFGPEGFIDHGFLWNPEIGEGAVRVLPSWYGAKHRTGWKTWVVRPVHAVNAELDQVGAASHWRFARDRMVFGPTVWLNASRCGTERPTTHDPFGLEDGAAGRRSVPSGTGRAMAEWRESLRHPGSATGARR